MLVTAQFAAQAIAVLATGGSLRGGPRALICCLAGDQVTPGALGELTARAGWALVAAQLLACLLLAVVVRGGRAGVDLVDRAVLLVRALLDAGRGRLAARILTWARGVVIAVHPRPRGVPPHSTARVRDCPRSSSRWRSLRI